MAEKNSSQKQLKQEGPEAKQVPGLEQPAATPETALVRAALAAEEDSPEGHARLLRDARIPAAQRQEVARRLGRTRGNRYVQRLVDSVPQPTAPARRLEGPAIQRDGETPSLEQKLREATEGLGTDEDAIYLALRTATADERRAVAGNGALLGMLRGDLSGDELLRAARLLAVGLTAAERSAVAAGLLDLSAAPAGKIRDATGLLMLSSLEVDRNTAQRILGGDMSVHYMEDLGQPPNLEATVRGYGRDPATWTLYYRPGTTSLLWVQTNAVGFRVTGSNIICGQRSLSLERWQTLLVHETNHARNPDPTTPLQNYQSEFRAYWVAEYRTVTDLDERARRVKEHVLRDYPTIRAAYDADEAVKRAIDAYTRPTGNITNI